ncbi:MAG: hypothetical protein ACRD1Z_09980, partial [Vicinamibacteria bacterium]
LMDGIAVNTLTPIGPELLELSHAYYNHKRCDPQIVAGFYKAYADDWELDIPIWNNKIFRPLPNLAEGDGEVGRFRRWYRQFYSDSVDIAI